MKSHLLAFESLVAAREQLLKNLAKTSKKGKECAIMSTNPCDETMSKISEKPIPLEKLAISNYDQLTPEVREMITRLSQKTYDESINSVRGKKTISKAAGYNIPFDEEDIDVLYLAEQIEEWESLLEDAAELELYWDETDYDIDGLKQAIHIAKDDPERMVRNENAEHRRDYYASIRLC